MCEEGARRADRPGHWLAEASAKYFDAQQPQKMSRDVPANTTASQRKKKCANFIGLFWKPIIQYAIVA